MNKESDIPLAEVSNGLEINSAEEMWHHAAVLGLSTGDKYPSESIKYYYDDDLNNVLFEE